MSTGKRIIFPTQLMSAQSLAANANSLICNIQYIDNVAIQINLANASTLNGQFQLYGSNDYVPSGFNSDGPATNGNFIAITGLNSPIVSGNPSNILWNLTGLAFAYVQVQWTNVSGTGTGTIILTGKAS